MCDDDPVRFQTAPYKLALDAESCEIRARWNVANQICVLRFLPERVLLLLLSLFFFGSHGQYRIAVLKLSDSLFQLLHKLFIYNLDAPVAQLDRASAF